MQCQGVNTSPLPHGGLRAFHQKSTYPDKINFKALCGTNWSRYPPELEATKPSQSTEWVNFLPLVNNSPPSQYFTLSRKRKPYIATNKAAINALPLRLCLSRGAERGRGGAQQIGVLEALTHPVWTTQEGSSATDSLSTPNLA